MRTRKELIYLNVNDITPEEVSKLADYELNICDICGEIEQSEKLHWIDGEDFWEDDTATRLVKEGNVAVCHDCLKKETEEDKQRYKENHTKYR